MKRYLMCLMLCVLMCVSVSAGEWSASFGADYETYMGSAVYSPDPNGGIGVMAIAGKYLPENAPENVAFGPLVRFNLGDVASAVVDRVIPGSWPAFQNAPARLYGTLGFLWELKDWKFVFAPGTELILFPDWHARPAVWTTYFKPASDSGIDEQFKVLFGVDYRF